MKNSGELLIESIISLLIIICALIPLIYSISNIKKINSNINSKISEDVENINLMEEVKSLNYEDFLKYTNSKLIKKETKYSYNLYKLEKIYSIKVGKYEDYYIP